MLDLDLGCQWAWGVVLFYGVVPCGVGWCGHSAPTLCCSHSRRALYEDSGAAAELLGYPRLSWFGYQHLCSTPELITVVVIDLHHTVVQ